MAQTNFFGNLTIGKRLMIGISIVIVIFITINSTSYTNLNKLVKGAELEKHTFEVLENIKHVTATIIDAETGQRGYILTGEKRYLEPYSMAIEMIDEEIEHVQTLTSDNPNQQKRIEELKPHVEEKLAELKETIDLRDEVGFTAAVEVVLTDRGKKSADAIREILQEMEEEEIVLLEARSIEARVAEKTTKSIILFGSLIGLALAILMILIITKSVNKVIEESVDQLISSSKQLSSSTEQTSAASLQSADIARSIATDASEQSKQVEEMSKLTEQLSTAMEEMSKSAQELR